MNEEIIWKNVLNSTHAPWCEFIFSTYWEFAKKTGYPYFTWNDRVYKTEDASFTGLFASDVK